MGKNSSAPTMKDVAREAGVALGTVSKVMNGIPVGEDYRRRVRQAAEKLGYQVNNYARGLKTNRTCTAALIVPSLSHPFFAALAHEVCQALTARGYRMIPFVTSFDPEAEQACIRMIRQNKVDGAIVLTYNPNLEVDPELPFVTIDRYFSATVPCVSSDNFGGGQLAAEKLIERGCRRLAFLRTGSRVPGEADKRGDGFEGYCRSRGIPVESLRLNDGDGPDLFASFLRERMEGGKLALDGIFCSTDRLAYDICGMLAGMGVRVPEDVQIIGFDGMRKFGDADLYCSTIVQPVRKLAETGVDLLLAEDRSQLPAMVCLPVSYLPGGTTREPPEAGKELGRGQ